MSRTTAKLFMHGRSQAVRLPKAFRMPGTEVEIWQVGETVYLRPVAGGRPSWDKISEQIESIGETPGFMEERDQGAWLDTPIDLGDEK